MTHAVRVSCHRSYLINTYRVVYGGVIVDTKGNNQQICVRLHLDNSVITSDASVRVRKLLVNGNNRRKRKGIEEKKKLRKEN